MSLQGGIELSSIGVGLASNEIPDMIAAFQQSVLSSIRKLMPLGTYSHST